MNRLDVFCFMSVARTLSFSLTARELMISQQAVSRHIRNLESEVGYPLFLRNYQNVILTKAGEKLLNYFTLREQLREEFDQKKKRVVQDEFLRIAWLQWLSCPKYFRELLERFQKEYPQVKLLCYDLDAKELRNSQVEDNLDFIVTTNYSSRYLPISWKRVPIQEEPIVILSNTENDHSGERIIWAVDAGESNDQAVIARTKILCDHVGIQPSYIYVTPEMGSVCMNILTAGGIGFGCGIPAIKKNGDFSITPTDRSATVILSMPFQTSKPAAALFENFIINALEERP